MSPRITPDTPDRFLSATSAPLSSATAPIPFGRLPPRRSHISQYSQYGPRSPPAVNLANPANFATPKETAAVRIRQQPVTAVEAIRSAMSFTPSSDPGPSDETPGRLLGSKNTGYRPPYPTPNTTRIVVEDPFS
jgi:hypothetical protein